jgi:hypothetical protein
MITSDFEVTVLFADYRYACWLSEKSLLLDFGGFRT